MAESFTLLDACNVPLPVARIVDRVMFYRFATLEIATDDGPHHAVFPPDWAVPQLVKELAPHGWPPGDLVQARGGVPLLDEWNEVPDQSRVQPAIGARIPDLAAFLADARLEIDGKRRKVLLNELNVTALTSGGRTLVRNGSAPLVLEVDQEGALVRPHAGDTIVATLPALVARGASPLADHRVKLTAENVRQLAELGTTWVSIPGDPPQAVRVATPSPTLGRDWAEQRPLPGSAPRAATQRTAAAAHALTDHSLLLLGASRLQPAMRVLAMASNEPVDPDPRPRIPNFRFVLYLPYAQEWKLVGFARGDLLNTIALTPQEETSIDVFSWDRQRTSSDTAVDTAFESSLETSASARLTRDFVHDVSTNEAWKLTGGGVQVGAGDVQVHANLSGDWGNTVNEVNKLTTSSIGEATVRGSGRFRGSRQTKVSESREFGFEQRTTRKLRNPNTCRTVAYDFFEILASYEVAVRALPDQVRLAVLVPNPCTVAFDRETILAHEGTLRSALLDRKQTDGFDAARWLAAWREHCDLRCSPACKLDPAVAPVSPGSASTGSGTSSPTVDLVTASASRVIAAGDAVVGAITKLRTAGHRVASAVDAGITGAQLEAFILEYRQWLFRVFGLEHFQPGFWGGCLRFEGDWGDPAQRTPERVEQLVRETGASWLESVGRGVLAVLLYPLAIPVMTAELVLHLGFKLGWYVQYTVRGFDDAGLGALLSQARTETDAWRKQLAAGSGVDPNAATTSPPDAGVPGPGPAATDGSGALAQDPYPLSEAALRIVSERSLIAHLEENKDHYMEAIWRAIPPVDQSRILRTAFDKLGQDLEPQLLGFLGDSIAVPFSVEHYPYMQKAMAKAIQSLEVAERKVDVVLPTSGVQVEARLGSCDACEPFIETHRQLDLAEKRAKVKQARALARQGRLEAERLQARLTQTPPLLDDPKPETAVVTVRTPPQG